MRIFLTTSILLFSLYSLADNIYVAPVTGSNISENNLKTIRELIKSQVQGDTNHNLVHNIEQADHTLQSKLIKFDTYTLTLSLWNGRDKVNSGQFKASDDGELETVIAKAVPEVISTKTNSNKAFLFENSKSLGEQAEEKKKSSQFETVEARQQVMVGFGPAYFSNLNAPGSVLGFDAGFIWNIDAHFDLGVQSNFSISSDNSDAYMLVGKIVTNYFFNTSDISPFVGGGFGYGWATVNERSGALYIRDDTASGFALSLQAGVKFFRTSNINFAVSGEFTNIFNKSSLGQPNVFFLKAALYF